MCNQSADRCAVSQMESRIWMNLTISYLFLWCISWDYSVPVTPLKIPSPHSQQVQTTGGHPSWPWINNLLFYIVEMKCILHRTPSHRPCITLTFDLQIWTAVHWRAVLRFLYPSNCPGLTAVCRPLCILCGFVLPSFIGHWETVTSFCSPTLLAFCSSASLWLWLDCSVLCSMEVAFISLWASCKKRKVISFILQTIKLTMNN